MTEWSDAQLRLVVDAAVAAAWADPKVVAAYDQLQRTSDAFAAAAAGRPMVAVPAYAVSVDPEGMFACLPMMPVKRLTADELASMAGDVRFRAARHAAGQDAFAGLRIGWPPLEGTPHRFVDAGERGCARLVMVTDRGVSACGRRRRARVHASFG